MTTTDEPQSSTAPFPAPAEPPTGSAGPTDPAGSPGSVGGPARRSRARKGEGPRLRDEILAATERLLLQTGSSEAVSIRAVADAVGVTPPSIYRHFPDKQTLIYEVCARHFAVLDEHIRKAIVDIDDPVEALAARGRAYVRFGVANPEPYRIMFMTRPEGTPLEMQEQWMRHSVTFNDAIQGVQDCIDAGRFKPGFTDAYRVCLGFWARIHGLTSLAISKPFLGIDDAFIDEYIDASLHGVVTT